MKTENKFLIFTAMGFELIALELVFMFIGSKVDKSFDWPGFAMVAGAVLGLVAWLIHIIAALRQIEKAEEEKEKKEKNS